MAFDGTRYHGWQIQRDAPTIQWLISEAIAKITGERVNLIGSGRTDAGTHARALVANFLTESTISPRAIGSSPQRRASLGHSYLIGPEGAARLSCQKEVRFQKPTDIRSILVRS